MATTATTKEPKMANDKSASINDIDFSKIDLAALKTLVDRASATFQERKVGELKTLVNGWILKAESVGYSISDVLDEVRSRLPKPAAPVKRTRAARGSSSKAAAAKPYVKGMTYKYQNDTWVGGTKGRQPPWLRDLIPATLSFDEQKAKFEELAVE